jgi:hypothetical protein
MGLALHHILQFNLDFGAGRYSNTIAVEIAFPVPARPYEHASYDLLVGQGCTNHCTSSKINKIILRMYTSTPIFQHGKSLKCS